MINELMSCLEAGYGEVHDRLCESFPINYFANVVFCGDWVAERIETEVSS